MTRFLIAAATLIVFTTATNADIVCTLGRMLGNAQEDPSPTAVLIAGWNILFRPRQTLLSW